MKLPLESWNRVIRALDIAIQSKEVERVEAEKAGYREAMKKAYIDRENFMSVRDRIAASNFSGGA